MKPEITKFPDGQIITKIVFDLAGSPPLEEVKMRINSYEDLFIAKSIREAMDNLYPGEPLSLYIPCLFGQRSDRRFEENESFGLKIICDFINSMGFSQVTVLDPHSDVSLALLNRSRKESSIGYVKLAVDSMNNPDLVLVSPDAGAYKKVFTYAGQFKLPCIAANKFRDHEGNIYLNILGDVKGKDCLIVDDLCDGGRTFIDLGKELKGQGAANVCLYVTHGYFSQGFSKLEKVLDRIYCTNSVKDVDYPNFVTQFKVV